MKMYCLDTYALFEIEKNNPRYRPIAKSDFIIPSAVLAEFCVAMTKRQGKKTGTYWFRQLEQYARDIDADMWMEGLMFREEHRKEKISIVDALGYVYARKNNLPFVTGDKAFENKPGVKFIK